MSYSFPKDSWSPLFASSISFKIFCSSGGVMADAEEASEITSTTSSFSIKNLLNSFSCRTGESSINSSGVNHPIPAISSPVSFTSLPFHTTCQTGHGASARSNFPISLLGLTVIPSSSAHTLIRVSLGFSVLPHSPPGSTQVPGSAMCSRLFCISTFPFLEIRATAPFRSALFALLDATFLVLVERLMEALSGTESSLAEGCQLVI